MLPWISSHLSEAVGKRARRASLTFCFDNLISRLATLSDKLLSIAVRMQFLRENRLTGVPSGVKYSGVFTVGRSISRVICSGLGFFSFFGVVLISCCLAGAFSPSRVSALSI